MIASCLACSEGITIDEYCANDPEYPIGCPKVNGELSVKDYCANSPKNPTGCTLVGGVVTPPPPPRSPQTLYKSLEVTFVSTTGAVLLSALIIVYVF